MAKFSLADTWKDEVAKADFLLQKGETEAAKEAKESIRQSFQAQPIRGLARYVRLEQWLDQSFENWQRAVKARGEVPEGQQWTPRQPAVYQKPTPKKLARVSDPGPGVAGPSTSTLTPEEEKERKELAEEAAKGWETEEETGLDEETKKRREAEERKKKEEKKREEERRREERRALEREQQREGSRGPTPTQPAMNEMEAVKRATAQIAAQVAAVEVPAPPTAAAVYANRLRQKPVRDPALLDALEKACHVLGVSAAEVGLVEGAETWGDVLKDMGDFSVSSDLVAELKAAYEFQGFDARLVARQMKEAGVSALHKAEGSVAGGFMDRLTLVVIGLMRGANLDKVRKGMKEANRANFDVLVKHYGIQSKPVDSKAITLPRVIATFPGMAMDVLKVAELGPVRHADMTAMVKDFPREMMFSAFPSLIPRDAEGVTEPLLSAYLLYQHHVSMVINPDYKTWDLQKQKQSLEGFARAAMESEYVTQRQRVLRLLEEGWVSVDEDGKKISLTPALAPAINAAAVLYQTRK
ncbi:N protein [Blacklegged tick phlebovirus 2]|nr:N protein [Blacklegged tick phlebovirus 2]AII01809.1 N protein [Blacklegged tick phlebovirus 2]